MNVKCPECHSTGRVDDCGKTRQCQRCRSERDVTECLLRHRKSMEDAKFLVEMYSYSDSKGFENMDGDDVRKLWRILEDGLMDGETSPF